MIGAVVILGIGAVVLLVARWIIRRDFDQIDNADATKRAALSIGARRDNLGAAESGLIFLDQSKLRRCARMALS